MNWISLIVAVIGENIVVNNLVRCHHRIMHSGVLYMAQIAATDSSAECYLYHEANPVKSAVTKQVSHS
jgi:hypothetical protein